MPTELKRICAIALALQLVAGCTTSSSAELGADAVGWGEANRQTMAAQIIDPTPQYDDAVPQTSGDKTAGAIERYRTDKVKKPERIGTGSGSGSSGK